MFLWIRKKSNKELKENKKEMKEKHFKFRKSFYDVLRDMTDKQAGEFVKGICGYAFEGNVPQTQDDFIKGAYLFAIAALDAQKRDSVNGKKGGDIVAAMKKNTPPRVVGVSITTMHISPEESHDEQ